jgi:uncharacterized protein
MAQDNVDVYEDAAGEWRWRRHAANGEIVSTSGEGYTHFQHAVEMATRLNPDAALTIIKHAT